MAIAYVNRKSPKTVYQLRANVYKKSMLGSRRFIKALDSALVHTDEQSAYKWASTYVQKLLQQRLLDGTEDIEFEVLKLSVSQEDY